MSYAMAPTFEGNRIGVRRVYQLSGMGTAPDTDTLNALLDAGFDSGLLQTAVAQGVTDEQLLALPYPDDSVTENMALMNLINQLGGAQAATGMPASSAGSFPSIIPSTISTQGYGTLDLSLASTWNQVSSLAQQTRQALTAYISTHPSDSTASGLMQQLNSAISSFSSAYQTVFGSGPSGLSGMGSFTSVATDAGIILGGIVMAATIGLPLTIIVGLLAGILYTANQYLNSQNAATAVLQTAANTSGQATNNQAAALTAYNQLLPQISAATKAGNAQLASQLQSQANVLLSQMGPLAPTGAAAGSLTAWFTQNWGAVAAVIVAIAVVPPLVKKL